jgi:hypothetical protein
MNAASPASSARSSSTTTIRATTPTSRRSRGDARRIRGDRRRRLPPAARLSGPRDVTPHDVPGPFGRGFSEAGRGARRGAEPRVVGAIPADRLRMHICWGNYEGPHDCDIALERILPILLQGEAAHACCSRPRTRATARVDGVARGGLPTTGAGARASSTPRPTTSSTRTRRPAHRDLAAIVGRERVIAGTDCGFGTFAGFGVVHPAIVYKKLAALAEGARLASARLWH